MDLNVPFIRLLGEAADAFADNVKTGQYPPEEVKALLEDAIRDDINVAELACWICDAGEVVDGE